MQESKALPLPLRFSLRPFRLLEPSARSVFPRSRSCFALWLRAAAPLMFLYFSSFSASSSDSTSCGRSLLLEEEDPEVVRCRLLSAFALLGQVSQSIIAK